MNMRAIAAVAALQALSFAGAVPHAAAYEVEPVSGGGRITGSQGSSPQRCSEQQDGNGEGCRSFHVGTSSLAPNGMSGGSPQ